VVVPYLSVLRAAHSALLTDSCTIYRNGVQVGGIIPCRIHSSRLLTETPDPTDANTRSLSEWGWTLPMGTNVQIGDEIRKADGTLNTIVGEVLHSQDTWGLAVRVWSSKPKDAVALTAITVKRFNETTETWSTLGTFNVRIHYDRNLPTETPVRFSPAGTTLYKSGVVAGDMTFDVQPGDRFKHNGLAYVIDFRLPDQPQRKEARFEVDVSGARMG
jgi:hypothetical protein